MQRFRAWLTLCSDQIELEATRTRPERALPAKQRPSPALNITNLPIKIAHFFEVLPVVVVGVIVFGAVAPDAAADGLGFGLGLSVDPTETASGLLEGRGSASDFVFIIRGEELCSRLIFILDPFIATGETLRFLFSAAFETTGGLLLATLP